MEKQYGRREFLAWCGLASLGVASMANAGCSLRSGSTAEGQAGASADSPVAGEADLSASPAKPQAEMEEIMGTGVAVGYASRTGSTKGVAEAIAEELRERGMSVDLLDMAAQPAPKGYEAAVLCSAVQGGAWLPEAQSYIEANAGALGDIPVALVCVHIMNAGDDDRARERRMAYLDKVRPNVQVAEEAFFLGRGPTAEEAGWVMRWAFKAFGGAGEGDLRDWDAIRGWARQLQLLRG